MGTRVVYKAEDTRLDLGRRIFDSERGVWSDGRGEFTCGNIVWRF
jgi:hypothetical protein